MSGKYTDKRADDLADVAEMLGNTQARRGRDAGSKAEDMERLESMFGTLSEQERLIAESHMDEEYARVDNILRHPVKRR